MASEYIKWQLRKEAAHTKEKEAPRPRTRKEILRNWFYYHKWHLLIGLLVIGIALEVIPGALGLGTERPDYQFAYVGSYSLPDDTCAVLEEALASLGEDANGDGRVLVRIHQYPVNLESDPENAAYNEASRTKLMADLEDCDSYFFLLEDPETFEAEYQILAGPDGHTGADEGITPCVLAWQDCPVPAGLSLGSYSDTAAGTEMSGDSQQLLAGLYLARRGFWTEKTASTPEACARLWQTLTAGAPEQ